tara:strand:- start:156 stop:434 length:279 start_codon:yes stop_codon:yes gene_type:complete
MVFLSKKETYRLMNLSEKEIDRIIEMAWEDRTPFEAIEFQFGLKENDVRKIMRSNLKESSFKLWRKRVKGRKTKHEKTSESSRFKSQNQKSH